ncbi:MAG: hypothetical protein CVT68_11675, partial [Actinobacteria bacterium HGW-Actinobacteria-8]
MRRNLTKLMIPMMMGAPIAAGCSQNAPAPILPPVQLTVVLPQPAAPAVGEPSLPSEVAVDDLAYADEWLDEASDGLEGEIAAPAPAVTTPTNTTTKVVAAAVVEAPAGDDDFAYDEDGWDDAYVGLDDDYADDFDPAWYDDSFGDDMGWDDGGYAWDANWNDHAPWRPGYGDGVWHDHHTQTMWDAQQEARRAEAARIRAEQRERERRQA